MDTKCLPACGKAQLRHSVTEVIRTLHLTAQWSDLERCRELLAQAGLTIQSTRVQKPEEFHNVLSANRFDLILSDYPVPGFKDLAALEQAKEICPNVPFIYFAAAQGEETVIEAFQLGAADYVLKEHPGRLGAAVRRALQKAEETRLERLARQQAEKAQGWLAAIVASSDDAIISKDLDGIITSWNHGAERLYGYRANEIIGKPVALLLPRERLGEEARILERLRRGERIERLETVRVTKSGRQVEVCLTISPVRDARGVVVGASKIARDISEQKKAEHFLQETHAKLSHYAEDLERQVAERTSRLESTIEALAGVCYHIAHDLRAPVRSVRSFTDLLTELHQDAFNPTGKIYITRIIEACTRMEMLIQDLLTYGRLSHTELPMGWVEVDEMLHSLLAEFSLEIQAKSAVVELHQPMPKVWANPTVLEQIVSNLLSNALKYVPRGTPPRIQIWSEETPVGIRLVVQDNGIGIARAHQERIFHMFERLHPETDYPGTGIGLAIVQKGVQRLKGSIRVESELGQGSRFIVELPRHLPHPAKEAVPQAA